MRITRAMAIVLILLALPGCYGRRIYELETRTARQDRRIEALKDSLTYVRHGVAYLDSTVGGASTPLRTDHAMTEGRMDELQTRLEILESLVKENRYQISQINMRRGRPAQAAGDTAEAPPDTTMLQASVATHIYETAYVDFVKGNFQSAIRGFSEFVKRYPMTDFSDDAQYMIGQSFFVLGDYPNAITEFRKVLDGYPQGDKVPGAMYKLALCYLEIDDAGTAREYFKILVNRYPAAAEARQAEERLQELPPEPE
jgi:tol-pal system protein YbgF